MVHIRTTSHHWDAYFPYTPDMHVWIECLDCLFVLPLQTEEVLSPRNPPRHHAKGRVLRGCGAGVRVCLVPFGTSVRGHWCTQA